MKKVRFLLPFLFAGCAFGAPSITSVSGTIQDGGAVTLSGSSFGTKSPAAPIIWATFDSNGNPTNLGTNASWSEIQNVSWVSGVGYGNSGGMQGTAGNGTWALRVDSSGFNWNDSSQKWLVMRRQKQNYLALRDASQPGYPSNSNTDNQKDFRVWPAGGSGYSNMYWSIQNGRLFVENIGGSTDSGFWSDALNPLSTSWMFQEIICQASSALGVKDGTLTYRIDGTQRASGNIISKSSAAPAAWVSMYPAHIVVANKGLWNPAWSASNQAWFDDVYVDKGWQRVIIGDASTYANCRKFGIIVPSAWSDTSITGTLQIHSVDFPAQTTAYMYVFDSSNAPNATGKAVLIGGTVAGNPPPVISSVTVSTGSYLGTTISTITGTGFSSGFAVFVGTTQATTTSLLNSTAIQFTIPVSTPGLSGLDLKVVNLDGQQSVLIGTMSYTSAPGNQAPFNVTAGDNWALTLPASLLLSGSASDDGLPNPPAALTYQWNQKSGPGTVTFGTPTALQTTASFSQSGTYTISLTASDSVLTTESSVVTVVVSPAVGSAFPWHK